MVWPPFSGWLQKFRNTDIVSLASPRVILELPSVVFSVCQNHYKKLVFCWHVFWQMHKLQSHKLVSKCDHLNVSTMYSIFDWKEFEILSYRQAFLQSTEIRASEELNALKKAPVQILPLRKLSGKVPVQFMPFRKLSRKCPFLIRFCTSNWSETYLSIKNPKASRALKWALDSSSRLLASLVCRQLLVSEAALPLDQILDPYLFCQRNHWLF